MLGPRFEEAYMTHTSTSPNYQILASLDVARRQVELEGYERVQSAIEKAVCIRRVVRDDPILSRHFRVLGVPDLIPRELSPVLQPLPDDPTGFAGAFRIERGWEADEIVLDPTAHHASSPRPPASTARPFATAISWRGSASRCEQDLRRPLYS